MAKGIKQEMITDALVNHTEKSGDFRPPVFVVCLYRCLFAFLYDDYLIDFHLNWLNWAAHEYTTNDKTPCIKRYLQNKNQMYERIDAIIENPKDQISPKKIQKIGRYINQCEKQFDELPKHVKVYSFVI